jgi:hypothetical protein
VWGGGSLIWHGTVAKGREVMGDEGESGGLKKKGKPIGPCWPIFSSWAGVQSNEGNKSRRK